MKKTILVLVGLFITALITFSLSPAWALYKEEEDKKEKVFSVQEEVLLKSLSKAEAQPSRLKIKDKTAQYAPGRVIIKFKDKAAATLAGKLSPQTPQLAPTKTGISSIDKLNSQIKVKRIAPVFKIKTPPGKNVKSTQAPSSRLQAKLQERVKRAPKGIEPPDLSTIYKVELQDSKADVLAICEKYKQDPNVEYCEPDYIVKVQIAPNDPYYHSTGSWGQTYPDMWGLKRIKMEQAWDVTQGRPDVIVAVSDSGVDYGHSDIQDKIWINDGEDLNHNGIVDTSDFNSIDDDGNGYVDDIRGYDFATCERWSSDGSVCLLTKSPDNNPADNSGHGTHVAGTIAATTNNATGVAGISWNSVIMPVRGLAGSGYISDLVNTIRYATDNGADIINMSWGGGGYSQALADAISYAYGNGVISVAAAGNDIADVSQYTPAGLPHVIAVAAWTPQNSRAIFSNWGELIDVTAPGEDILSLRAEGTDMYGDGLHFVGAQYYRASGTSMSAPHVSGVAALILATAANRGFSLSNDLVELSLQRSAEDVLDPGKDLGSGYGLLDAQAALNLTNQFCNQPLPELVVRNVIARFRSDINQFEISGEIFNFGLSAATNIPYNIYLGDSQGGTLLYQGVIPALSAGESTSIHQVITKSLNELDKSLVTLEVDPDNGILEYMETNNEGQVTIKLLTELPGRWPRLFGTSLYTSMTICDLDPSYPGLEIVVGAYHPVNGVFAYHADGTPVAGWYPQRTGPIFFSSPTVADLDPSYPGLEVVVGDLDNKVYVWHADGVLATGWPQTADGDIWSSPAIADIDGDGSLEIVVCSIDYKVHAWHINGTYVTGWPKATGGRVIHSPAIADIDPTYPGLEIVAASRDNKIHTWHADGTYVAGWPQPTGGWNTSSPAIADLDKDGSLEIIVGSQDHKVYAWHANGTVVAGWPKTTDLCVVSSPAIADIDGDGGLEVIVGSLDNKVYAWHANGDSVTGWPKITGGWVISSPAIADLDGDGHLEVAIGSDDGKVYAWNADGTLVPGFPEDTGGALSYNSPTIGDIDGNGTLEMVVGGEGKNVHVWTLPWISNQQRVPWPMFQHNLERTGLFNHPPVLSSIGNKQIAEGSKLTFGVLATDMEDEELIYTTNPLPQGATFDSDSKVFEWTPTSAQAGNHLITFTVSDGQDTDSEDITITVNELGSNYPPVLTSIGDQTIDEGQTLTFTLSATDPDGDTLTYSAGNLPSGASFDADTHTFNWAPDYIQSGTYTDVHFEVNDGKGGIDNEDIAITVNNVNQKPTLEAVSDKIVNAGEELRFTLSASDPEGDGLSYAVSELPDNASLNAQSGEFTWSPLANQAGTYTATFTVTDNGSPALSDSHTATITVVATQFVFSFNPASPQVFVNNPLTFTVLATDKDNEEFTLSASSLPKKAKFKKIKGMREVSQNLEWTPTIKENDVGDRIITFTAANKKGISQSQDITIKVENHAPVFTALPPEGTIIYTDQKYSFEVSAQDEDKDKLTLTAEGLPKGVFNKKTGNNGQVTQTLKWKPKGSEKGTYNATFSVTDGYATTTQTSNFTVANTAPILDKVNVKPFKLNKNNSLDVSFKDIDKDNLTLTAEGTPSGATLEIKGSEGKIKGKLKWKPTGIGNYPVTFSVSDNDPVNPQTASTVVTINVVAR